MAEYKFNEARAAGVSDEDIVTELKKRGTYNYKFDEASAAGVSPTEMIDFLVKTPDRYNEPTTQQPSDTLSRMEEMSAMGRPTETRPEPTTQAEPISMQEGIEELGTQATGVAAGFARFPLGVQYLGEAGLNLIPGVDLHKAEEWIASNESYIKENNLEGEALLGEILSSIGGGIAAGGVKSLAKVAATEGAIEGTISKGTGETNEEAAGRAALAAGATAVIGKVAQKVMQVVGPLSKEAINMINKSPNLNEGMMIEKLKGIPKEDQAYAIANMIEDDYVNFTIKSVAGSATDKLKLKQQLGGRTDIVLNTIGDAEKQVAKAKADYGSMIDMVSEGNQMKYGFNNMLPKIEDLIKRYDKTPNKSLSIVNNMKADLEAGNGMMDVRTALQFRQDLNYLLNKAKRYEEKAGLNTIKEGVDRFLSKNLDADKLKIVDESISKYSQAMNNSDFIELMDKFTKKTATDWKGLKKALKKEKLSSPEVNNAVNIVEEFSKKFSNDPQLRKGISPKGQAEDPGGMLGLMSYAINKTRDTLIPFGSRARELDIQRSILGSIRRAKNPEEVFEYMRKAKVPEKLIKDLEEPLNQIAFKPGKAMEKSVTETMPRSYKDQGKTMVDYDGKAAELVEEGSTIKFDNSSFKEGSGQGGRFYEDIFNVGANSGKKVEPDGPLIGAATYRYPIAIMKHMEKGKPIDHIMLAGKPADRKALSLEADIILNEMKQSKNKMRLSPENIALLRSFSTKGEQQ